MKRGIITTKIYKERKKHSSEDRMIDVWYAQIDEDYGTWRSVRDFITYSEAEAKEKLKEKLKIYG